MISHGLVSGALFLCVGVIYDRMHTREIAAYGGLVTHAALCRLLHGVHHGQCRPAGTAGFVGEFLTLVGAFNANSWVALFATTGVILAAAYALYLYRRVVFGVLDKASLAAIADLSPREIAIFAPLALTIYYGVRPGRAGASRRFRRQSGRIHSALLARDHVAAARPMTDRMSMSFFLAARP